MTHRIEIGYEYRVVDAEKACISHFYDDGDTFTLEEVQGDDENSIGYVEGAAVLVVEDLYDGSISIVNREGQEELKALWGLPATDKVWSKRVRP